MIEVEKYYSILGVSSSASIDEIKKVFRQKAKLFHPDINKDSNAADMFRDIHEAYEMLIFLKTGKEYNAVKDQYQYSKNKNNETAQSARDRAEHFAKQSYTQYKNSEYYKKSKLIKEVRVVYEVGFYMFIVFVIPGILMLFDLKGGFYFFIGLFFITMPHWIQLIPQVARLSWERIKEGNKYVYFPAFSIHWILRPAAIIIYMTIGFRTFISVFELLIVALILWIAFIFFFKYRNEIINIKLIFRTFYFSFLVLNGLLLLNYIVSFNSKVEVYRYENTFTYTRSGRKPGSLIHLMNNKGQYIYYNYLSIRFFWDYESIHSATHTIGYTTKEGLFGYKIYTDREFDSGTISWTDVLKQTSK